MKTTIKVKQGDPVPEGARFLQIVTEIEQGRSREEWRRTPGIMGSIPIFGTETLYRITPRFEVHYVIYEIDVPEKDANNG